MPNIFNVYCDESCHLENDGQGAMVLGAIWCPENERKKISRRIKEIKIKHKIKKDFEIKWTKVSNAKIDFYLDLIDYFFDNNNLHFRALVIPNKSILDHASYGNTHDDWYYKMYFNMLKFIFDPSEQYKVYLDIKDTLGKNRVEKLHQVLCNNAHDFSKQMIKDLKLIRSHEVEQIQIADLLIGAISYINRGLLSSTAKVKVIERIKHRSNYNLTHSTLPKENKLNIFIWGGSELG